MNHFSRMIISLILPDWSIPLEMCIQNRPINWSIHRVGMMKWPIWNGPYRFYHILPPNQKFSFFWSLFRANPMYRFQKIFKSHLKWPKFSKKIVKTNREWLRIAQSNIKIRQHKIIEPFVRKSDLMILMIGDKIKYLKSDFISPNKKSHYYYHSPCPPIPVRCSTGTKNCHESEPFLEYDSYEKRVIWV